MTPINFFTLELKFNRHKIKFKTDEKNGSILFGGMEASFSDYLFNVITPIVLVIIYIAVFTGTENSMSWFSIWSIIVLITFALIRLIGFGLPANKNIKVIGIGYFLVIDGEVESYYKEQDIKGFEIQIKKSELSGFIGAIFVNTVQSSNIEVLVIEGNDEASILDDLQYFKKFFERMIYQPIKT
jgi:hypothetical protein